MPGNPYLECDRCGTWAQPDFSPGKFESDEDVDQGKEQILAFEGVYDDLARRLLLKFRPRSVMDVGSRYPLLLARMRAADPGLRVLGVDGCNSALEYGKELGVPVVVGDFLEADLDELEFDLITMIHVIEHFPDPAVALAKVHDLLSPGGRVFLRTPRSDSDHVTEHLTPKHYQVHPYLFSVLGMSYLVASLANKDGSDAFSVVESYTEPTWGSFDIILRKSG